LTVPRLMMRRSAISSLEPRRDETQDFQFTIA
jgi:hypothetical protein